MGADVGGEGGDAGEGGAGFLAAGDFYAEFLFQFNHEFEGVDGVEAEAAADERFVVRDVGGRDVLEAERLDDEDLEFGFERIGHGESREQGARRGEQNFRLGNEGSG